MKPIDGEKLIDEIKIYSGKYNTKFGDGMGNAFDLIIKWIERGDFNLPPGTIIIKREVGYEKRPCITCIWSVIKFCQEYRCDNCPPDGVPVSKCTQHCKDCKYLPPCYDHISPEEIENAHIIGGDE